MGVQGGTVMLRTNEKRLVKIAVQGKVANAAQWGAFEVSHLGKAFILPSTGGITYNVKIGDPAFGWAGDHIEPGVSAILSESNRSSKANMGFNFLSCAGNKARLLSGEAKGKTGMVAGHHGGVEHVIIDFDQQTLNKMSMDDKILIEGYGQGLELADHPDIKIYNLDPAVLKKMKIKENRDGTLEIPVTTIVPGSIMGSGVGSLDVSTGDYDIMTHDQSVVKKHNIDKICFGDFVAIMDHDNSYGRAYRKGAVTIGIVIHSDCLLAGHGPGVTTLITSAKSKIKPVIDPKANLGCLMGVGKYRKKNRG